MEKINIRRSVFDGITFGFLICVILIAVFSPTDDDMLNLSKNTSIFIASFFVSAILSYFLNAKGIKTLGETLFEPDYKKVLSQYAPWYRTFSYWHLIILIVVLFVVGIRVTEFSIIKLLDIDGYNGVKRIFKELLDPNFQLLPVAVLRMFETIFMAFLATAMAIPIAFVISFLAAKNIMNHPLLFVVYLFIRTLLNVVRSIEAFMWAIIFSIWVGIGAGAGMLALMIHSIASLAKQYSEIVETVSDGPIEGVQATGAGKLQTIWFAIVPQVILPYISFTVYRWDINVRMATIVGFVGGGGIGKLLIAYQGQAMWREMGCIFFVIAVVVWLLDQASAYIREALK